MSKNEPRIPNPYRAGAGHSPPHLAGRQAEVDEFRQFLQQEQVTKNVVLTGLRGVGKTVLMEDRYRPTAIEEKWVWVGSDFSESAFLNEDNLCLRLITDLSVFSSHLTMSRKAEGFGFTPESETRFQLDFDFLSQIFTSTPGLTADKLKAVLSIVWNAAKDRGIHGIVFAYDEAQVVADHKEQSQYPLAVLLETFQSLQRKGDKYLLLLTGLPTVFPRLVEARTYAERMFTVQEIGRLTPDASREAIETPLATNRWKFSKSAVNRIINVADGYPYFIQFICKQAYDYFQAYPNEKSIELDPIVRQLDANFFSARWETLTDRQREFLYCVAMCSATDDEFSIPEIVSVSESLDDPQIKRFTSGDVSQMIPRMTERGFIYKNRHGKYSFAVPLFSAFIKRTMARRKEHVQKTLFGE